MKKQIINIVIILSFISISSILLNCGGSNNTFSKSSPFIGVWQFTFYPVDDTFYPVGDKERTVDIKIQKDGTFKSEIYLGKYKRQLSDLDTNNFRLRGGVFDDGKIEGDFTSIGSMIVDLGSLSGELYISNQGKGNFFIGTLGPQGTWEAYKK